MGEVKVTVPSHCELMLHVSKILGEKMNKMQLKLPSISYIMNTNARRTRDIAMISKNLIYGVSKPVYWYDNLSILYELGTRKFLKISQSNILTEMGEKYYPDAIWKKIII